jgi:hypothetical protein
MPGRARALAVVALLTAALATAAASRSVATSDPVVMAAGDIACDPASHSFHAGQGTGQNCRELATSDLILARHPAAVLALGDTQYECGVAADYPKSYAPSWGRLKARTHPAVGNHEYGHECSRDSATAYFDYFGSRAGAAGKGWYSFDVGSWHLIALNSECGYGKKSAHPVGGCDTGDPQEEWLAHDLASHPSSCTLAYWHEPRFSSGHHGDAQSMATIWNDLVAAHVDVVLSGHNHDYERFAPAGTTPQIRLSRRTQKSFQPPNLDPAGIREFVVGTGGDSHEPFGHAPLRGEVVRNDSVYGVLELTLHAHSYDWRFVPVPGESFTDSGTGSCH